MLAGVLGFKPERPRRPLHRPAARLYVRLSPLELAAVLENGEGRSPSRGRPHARACLARRRRPESLDGAARWPKLHATPARGPG
jgi:hypothetical protein